MLIHILTYAVGIILGELVWMHWLQPIFDRPYRWKCKECSVVIRTNQKPFLKYFETRHMETAHADLSAKPNISEERPAS